MAIMTTDSNLEAKLTMLESYLRILAIDRNNITRLLSHKADIRVKIDDLLREHSEYSQLVVSIQSDDEALNYIEKNRTELEKDIRRMTSEIAQEFPEATLPTGASVKRFDKLEITDEQAAKLFLVYNRPDALRIDEKMLLEIVKVLKPPFAKVESEPRGQIASDLSAYLADDKSGETSQDNQPEPKF